MINPKFVQQLKKEYAQSEGERRQIIALANIVLHDSKRVIFSLHRNDAKTAAESLANIEKILKDLDKKFGYARVMEEGSYRAGVEEYVEAKLFYLVCQGKKVDKFPGMKIDVDGYLGGISDLTGEMVRRAVNSAAEGDYAMVEKMKKGINDIMAGLVEFDMTGYLRTKYDQAKNNLRKMEQVAYEIKLRRKEEE